MANYRQSMHAPGNGCTMCPPRTMPPTICTAISANFCQSLPALACMHVLRCQLPMQGMHTLTPVLNCAVSWLLHRSEAVRNCQGHDHSRFHLACAQSAVDTHRGGERVVQLASQVAFSVALDGHKSGSSIVALSCCTQWRYVQCLHPFLRSEPVQLLCCQSHLFASCS